jgi:hypothetical protein
VYGEVVLKAAGTPCVKLRLTPLLCVQEIEVRLGGYQPTLTAHMSLVFSHIPTVARRRCAGNFPISWRYRKVPRRTAPHRARLLPPAFSRRNGQLIGRAFFVERARL